MYRPTRVRLDLNALKNNLKLLKQWNGQDFFCPMVKANAYGHGAVAIAHAVEDEGATAMGVALVEEGLALRAAGVTLPILVFAPFDHAAISAMVTHQLTPVVTRFKDLEALSSLKFKSKMAVHIKFNTGMCRLGFDAQEVPQLTDWLRSHPEVEVKGACTHLSYGDEPQIRDGATDTQLRGLVRMAEGLTTTLHGHKSATLSTYAALGASKRPGIGARPGISIYGLPHEGLITGPGLRPVLTWSTQVTHVHKVKKGDGVSYGARWRAERPSVIGVLPVGYGDGYSRALSNRAKMLFRGQRVSGIGSVCMDYTMVDLTDAVQGGEPQAGEEVVLIGRQGDSEVSAGELAQLAGTIAYEIVTAISARVVREV